MQLERELKRFIRQIRPGLIGATSNPNVNLAQVVAELRSNSELRGQISQAMREFLVTRDFVAPITETGLTLESNVFTEIYKRLEYKIMPKLADPSDILGFLAQIFDARSDSDWLEHIDRDLFADFLALILPPREQLIEPLAPQIFISLEILCLRLAGLGYDPTVSRRLVGRKELQHAFMEAPRHVHALIDNQRDSAMNDLRASLTRVQEAVIWIRSRRSIDGASLGLTYRLMKIEQVLARIHLVIQLIESLLGQWNTRPAMRLFFDIVLADMRRFELGRFLSQNFSLLAYQITEHTGRSGEHYIARDRGEWFEMLRSAVIGGAIVALAAVIKILLAQAGLPPIPLAVSYCLLYTAAFMVILECGGTVATKQPAMTANTLAHALDDASSNRQAMENLADVVVSIVRTQFIAVVGNFFAALLGAGLVCFFLFHLGFPLMSEAKAAAELDAISLITSFSVPYAILAGVFLFASGLVAGGVDNWFVFNQVSSRLKQSDWLRRFVNPGYLKRTIKVIEMNLGFWASNVFLGLALGVIASLSPLLGFKSGNAHVSFAAGTLGAAAASLNFKLSAGFWGWLLVSAAMVGVINLAVSFSLSLFVAIRSRGIRFRQTPELVKLLLKKALFKPHQFFFPPRAAR